MLGKQSLPKADLVSGAVLIALGTAVIVAALGMPMGGQYGGVSNPWYASPGMLPLLIGATLVLLSAMLVVRALRQGALGQFGPFVWSVTRRVLASRATWRAMLIWALLGLYAAALYLRPAEGLADAFAQVYWLDNRAGRFLLDPAGANYVTVSLVFLGSFIWLFYRPAGRRPGWRHLPLVAGLSLLVSLLVGFSFSELLNVPLP